MALSSAELSVVLTTVVSLVEVTSLALVVFVVVSSAAGAPHPSSKSGSGKGTRSRFMNYWSFLLMIIEG